MVKLENIKWSSVFRPAPTVRGDSVPLEEWWVGGDHPGMILEIENSMKRAINAPSQLNKLR